MITLPILLKGLAAAVIVGFVTSSIKTWVDRVFLVILLVGLVGLPIEEAINVNLIAVAAAAVLMTIRQRKMLRAAVPPEKAEWSLIVFPAVLGGILGKIASALVPPKALLVSLGFYAILVGIRILLVKPLQERPSKLHIGWLAPVGFGSGLLAGFISAGGKPFAVAAYNNAMGHHPQKAYAYASLGVAAAAWSALAAQAVFVRLPSWPELGLAAYEFVLVTLVALFVNTFWSAKLNKVVNFTIAPILILVGLRFAIMGFAAA